MSNTYRLKYKALKKYKCINIYMCMRIHICIYIHIWIKSYLQISIKKDKARLNTPLHIVCYMLHISYNF